MRHRRRQTPDFLRSYYSERARETDASASRSPWLADWDSATSNSFVEQTFWTCGQISPEIENEKKNGKKYVSIKRLVEEKTNRAVILAAMHLRIDINQTLLFLNKNFIDFSRAIYNLFSFTIYLIPRVPLISLNLQTDSSRDTSSRSSPVRS